MYEIQKITFYIFFLLDKTTQCTSYYCKHKEYPGTTEFVEHVVGHLSTGCCLKTAIEVINKMENMKDRNKSKAYS